MGNEAEADSLRWHQEGVEPHLLTYLQVVRAASSLTAALLARELLGIIFMSAPHSTIVFSTTAPDLHPC